MSDYEVRILQETYEIYELVEHATGSSVRICPERGGIATELVLHGKSLFYLDRDTFTNPKANIRGGNPILFPICGQLPDRQYEWEGKRYTMNNHGVARVQPWEVVGSETAGQAALTLRLCSNDSTLAEYPFEFELLFTYVLKDGVLRIDQQYSNRSGRPMPMYAGFHPYFATTDKSIAYETDATVYLDYNDDQVKPIQGAIDLNGLVESVALLDAGKREIAFPLSNASTVRLSYSDEFKYVVLWSVDGKPFICVEPWMAKTTELVMQKELPIVEAGETLSAWLAFACETKR